MTLLSGCKSLLSIIQSGVLPSDAELRDLAAFCLLELDRIHSTGFTYQVVALMSYECKDNESE